MTEENVGIQTRVHNAMEWKMRCRKLKVFSSVTSTGSVVDEEAV